MAALMKQESYQVAEAVLAVIATLMDEDLSSDHNIVVGGFTNTGNTGLALKSGDLKRRCNLFGDQRSDAIAMCIGTAEDFEYKTGHARESADRYLFETHEYYQAAEFVVAWLCKGEVVRPDYRDNAPPVQLLVARVISKDDQ